MRFYRKSKYSWRGMRGNEQMNHDNIREQIGHALGALADGDFVVGARDLLAVLGYESTRTLDISGRVNEFIAQFPAPNENTQTEQVFCENAQSVRILFQVTDTEITVARRTLLPTASFDSGNARSFLFAAVELNGKTYSRGQYAQFTREINKRINMPTVVLFKTVTDHLTLSFVHRREHKRDPNRDVLAHVSLIREIDPIKPHRAHLDILSDLSLPQRLQWMNAHDKPHNFDGLLAAWLNALDTEALNRRFYGDLFGWFERAIREAKFPSSRQKRTLPPEEHIIRLITRLMFVWFIKEKRLIATDLFSEERIARLLKNYDRDAGDSYYRAVLQNLFFATLNTERDRRGFSQGSNATHRNFSRYRYKKEIADPTQLLALFDQTPFINGGLFDCLDSEEATRDGGYRIDCFTDKPSQRRDYSIPNRLFFDDDGLIPLFNRYKFTVEENTPVEQEVALDPELLGKVFENLLAAYNPETRDTARKQTGSYYTPRPVVDYMVDEALVATLAQACSPSDSDTGFWQDRLRYLLDYEDAFNDAHELFEEGETAGIVRAISEIKVLDPAVGSGAFPMGMLHKMAMALRRLDPDNQRWATLQKERARTKADAAFDTKDPRERKAELNEISDTFERYSGDFGRKLYLIQNSIFGVDIQPIATQIAKLRFFISLAIEQEPNKDADNFGIKPLPNLETRFIAADTLMQLKAADQLDLFRQQIEALQTKLTENRERHFHATTRPKKLACRDADNQLRRALADELNSAGLPEDDAKKITHWDPYDQNAKADWFDPEYMFGIADGFDIVIGNPPYVRQENIGPHKSSLLALYSNAATARSDLYCYFYARGLQVLRDGGMHVFVCSNSWLDVGYGAKLQEHLLKNAHIQAIYESAVERQFSTADINTIISVIRKTTANDDDATRFVHLLESFEAAVAEGGKRREIVKSREELNAAATNPQSKKFIGDKWGGKYLRAPNIYHAILNKCADKLVRLGDIATVRFGIKTGANDFFYLTSEVIAEWGIEPEFYRPVMTSPQESRRIAIDPAELPRRLFMCHRDEDALEGMGALAYIAWGAAQGYHQRRSVASRRRWYDLGKRDGVYLGMNKLVDTTARTFLMLDNSFLSDNFQVMSFDGDALLLCAALNATFFQLMLNTEARTNFGSGVLEIQTYETANIAVVNPSLLPALDAELFASSDWDVLTPSPERRQIDDAVFDALALTAGEREAVYAGVAELVNNRKQRARVTV